MAINSSENGVEKTTKRQEKTYCVVRNIPGILHSADLRNYFSQWLETGAFECFHFRHRPEIQSDVQNYTDHNNPVNLSQPKTAVSTHTTCCVISVKRSRFNEFSLLYHRKHWLDSKGDIMQAICIIDKIKLSPNNMPSTTEYPLNDDCSKYKTKSQQKQIPTTREAFSRSDLDSLPELNPPSTMPRGNVGTPTQYFLNMIKLCRLPPLIIKKLGLRFPRKRPRKQFSSVPFSYGETEDYDDAENAVAGDEISEVRDAEGRQIFSDLDYSLINPQIASKTTKSLKEENIEEKFIHYSSDSNDDADECEEWERHEAFCDDPGTQERTKERLFEEEIELKWEKGGSGLVFYTDAQYWQEKEGDFDEQTTDDWDVDMSVYYDESAGDKDSRDLLSMRRERKRRFSPPVESKIGEFEKHTKGIGRKVLQQQGWKDGSGLGQSVTGITEALENEGQSGRDKSGFGYRGEKLAMPGNSKCRVAPKSEALISTIYDEPHPVDEVDGVYRSCAPTTLKYRR